MSHLLIPNVVRIRSCKPMNTSIYTYILTLQLLEWVIETYVLCTLLYLHLAFNASLKHE